MDHIKSDCTVTVWQGGAKISEYLVSLITLIGFLDSLSLDNAPFTKITIESNGIVREFFPT